MKIERGDILFFTDIFSVHLNFGSHENYSKLITQLFKGLYYIFFNSGRYIFTTRSLKMFTFKWYTKTTWYIINYMTYWKFNKNYIHIRPDLNSEH